MIWLKPVAFILVSVSTLAFGQLTSGIDDDAQASEVVNPNAQNEIADAPDSTVPTVDVKSETASSREESAAMMPSGGKVPDSNDVSEGTLSESVEVAAPISLDELLRQVHQTPRLQHEATLARLAERKRLAIAIHATLEAAEQVADFGLAGTELLNDASLDKVVETMIAQRANELHKQKQSSVVNAPTPPSAHSQPQDVPTSMADKQEESGFDDWRPVYVVKDARGHRIGWQHQSTDARVVTYVGEPWRIGTDTVSVIAVATDGSGRYLVVDVNGEQREIHFY